MYNKKNVENRVLDAFQKEMPSVYFSDKVKKDFENFKKNFEYTYRILLNFPLEMFLNKTLLDFGAGSGEDTVIFSQWGAACTLVEMNPIAHNLSKKVFKKYSKNFTKHKFVNKSIFDFNSKKKFDIVHCRGVLSHTYNKKKGFNHLVSFLKPGGYLIFGDPNLHGGFQNMLQRQIVYTFGKNEEDMVNICEDLFSADITRSKSSISGRTRRRIIFDRWIIKQQDDPSVNDVMSWFHINNLEFYSSYPRFQNNFSDSFNHNNKLMITKIKNVGILEEINWMMKKDTDKFIINKLHKQFKKIINIQNKIGMYFQNISDQKSLNLNFVEKLIKNYQNSLTKIELSDRRFKNLLIFLKEVFVVSNLIKEKNYKSLKKYLKTTKILFKGFVGVRHVDFIGYLKNK